MKLEQWQIRLNNNKFKKEKHSEPNHFNYFTSSKKKEKKVNCKKKQLTSTNQIKISVIQVNFS